ncbi:ACT domain-containing protein [Pseudofrankia sp. DC12]|uniref:ACT domain-containing protein n=1 Tax=Pseudofrankia sp. DC12 TaxID=683315 RepID=UPI0005F861B7|nr:ACT domain-containing protein [Pseudofrankia sp. DC12]
MSYLLRLLLPDRPGALGAVATALGRVGIDIISLAVVERTADGAVDDLVVQLPTGGLADSALTAAHSVAGVRVESLRPYLADGAGVSDDLDLVDALTDRPGEAAAMLADLVPGVFHADWALLLDLAGPGDVRIREASVGAPDLGLDDYASPPRAIAPVPWLPLPEARVIDPAEGGLPERWSERGMELAAAPVGCPELVILIGRPGGPRFRSSEVARLAHLAGITASLSRTAL